MNQAKIPVVVVGAGIVGVTTAYMLQKSGKYQVFIVSECLITDPQDKVNQSWASPFAGANWHAYATDDDLPLQELEQETLRELKRLADEQPESGIKRTFCHEFVSAKDYKEPWFVRSLDQTRYLPKESLPFNCDIGIEFATVIINAPHYLEWMTKRFLAAGGAAFKGRIDALSDATEYIPRDLIGGRVPIIVNCAALGNLYLSDVKDTKMHPVRGQVVLVDAPKVKLTISNTPAWKYVIPRGDGTVILGGTYLVDNWSTTPDNNTTAEILTETIKFCPELIGETTPTTEANLYERVKTLRSKIIKVNVGFRPLREGGPRIEAGSVNHPGTGVSIPVVHNYGHGGYGYQSSWASAAKAKKLVDSIASKSIYERSRL
ncbi:hypothetical protein BB560_000382 [Smittium megazygosporum]|uniref:FAD dependent oxidoreductase domain-containing protein n=1 Tax=Smittium megazygosporum TaxID=133381 RepID=A0A2T9ZKG0_9FUNG|nr:hypothetical protein BB560_000382 [Smittium megazygosporum]